MYTVLVCDDEQDIVDALRIYLTAEGYHVLIAGNGKEAVKLATENTVHLVLLDVMMPSMDGISATAKIRETGNMPIVLLTAKSESSDKILGLGIGADDYITKPFDPAELLARVKAQLRRYSSLGSMPHRESLFEVNGLVLDDNAKKVTLHDENISLTPKEYEILMLLMSFPDKVFSSKEIYRRVWNENPVGADGTVAVHIRHLREKIEIGPANPQYIQVIWGHGYKINKEKRVCRKKS